MPDKTELLAAEEKARALAESKGYIYWGGGEEAPTAIRDIARGEG